MKQKLLLLTILFFAAILSNNAQISLKRVLNNSKERAENKIENRLENKIDNTVDNALDDDEGKNRKDKKKKDKDSEEESNEMIGSDNGGQENQEDNNNQNTTTENNQKQANASPTVVWNKFDFVPGDKIIFEDSPLASEENGEFPSRWDLIQGQVEIGNINGENVLMFLDGGEIIPYMGNSSEDYLPEVFTIEFDYYTPKDGNRLSFYLKDKKNQSRNGENVQ